MEGASDDETKREPLRRVRSRLDNVFMLANQKAEDMSQEIRKIEQSFGGNEHLMQRLTLLDFTAEMDKSNPVDDVIRFHDNTRRNSYNYDTSSADDEAEEPEAFAPVSFSTKLKMVDGPGLDPEQALKPSISNMATTLFKLKAFKDRLKGKGPPNSLAQSLKDIPIDPEAVVL